MAFINVKVYSVALYVEPNGAAAALSSGKTLLSGEFQKMLVIKLARKVSPRPWEGSLSPTRENCLAKGHHPEANLRDVECYLPVRVRLMEIHSGLPLTRR